MRDDLPLYRPRRFCPGYIQDQTTCLGGVAVGLSVGVASLIIGTHCLDHRRVVHGTIVVMFSLIGAANVASILNTTRVFAGFSLSLLETFRLVPGNVGNSTTHRLITIPPLPAPMTVVALPRSDQPEWILSFA